MLIDVADLSWFNWARFANVAQIAISRFVYGEATTKTGTQQLKIALNVFDADWNLLLRNCPPEGNRTTNRFTSIFN